MAARGVRSSKSWKVNEPENDGSVEGFDGLLEVWVTLSVRNWPWATVALTSGLVDVTE